MKKNTNTRRLSVKVANNQFDQTHWDDSLKICCLYAVLVLPGSVETQLGWSGKFYQLICRVFLPVSIGIKSTETEQEKPEL